MLPQTHPKVQCLPMWHFEMLLFFTWDWMQRFSSGYGGLVGHTYHTWWHSLLLHQKGNHFNKALCSRGSQQIPKKNYKSTKCPYLSSASPTDYFPNIYQLTLNWGLRGFALRGFVFTMVATSSLSVPFPTLTEFLPSPPYFSSVISHVEQISLTLIPTSLTYPSVIQAHSSDHLSKSLCNG